MELKQYEEKVILEYFNNDDNHQYIHAIEVMNMALDINNIINLGINKSNIIIAAITHDAFKYKGKEHPDYAYKFILDNATLIKKEYKIENNDINLIAMACLQHHSHYIQNFNSPLAELINLANRIVNKEFDSTLMTLYNNASKEKCLIFYEAIFDVYREADFLFFQSQELYPEVFKAYNSTPKKLIVEFLINYFKANLL
ncbi:MAG: hypothetical protein PWP46_80 [Fusobacteriaceae bacterium]|jgi:HD superfamily phosphohydrolase YqeK|nr:hypothetical protein [Fusobacteriales bacterium]MDN5303201.1 hypothetical protein [Fusobacteriaceae bacterium]